MKFIVFYEVFIGKMDTKADMIQLNLSRVCRVCAKPSDFLIHLSELLDNGRTLDAMLNEMIHIWRIENAQRPTNICLDCKPQLIAAFEFYSLALKSEQIFKEYDGYKLCYDLPAISAVEFDPFEYCEIKLEGTGEDLSDFEQSLDENIQIAVHLEESTSATIAVDLKKSNTITTKKQSGAKNRCNRQHKARMSVTTDTRPNVNDRSDPTFQCFDCKAYFNNRMQLIKHMPVHEIKCNVCAGDFHSLNEYKSHICDGAKNIQCQYCSKQCESIDQLLNHLETEEENTVKMSFKCGRCAKTFFMQHLLDLHAMAHNSRPYPCDICGKKYSNKRQMKNHSRFVHSTVRRK